MSTPRGEDLFNIGVRLKEERERLQLSQEALGTRLATTGRTIKKYEANETSIRATELLQFSGLGADVLYIVTGERQSFEASTSRPVHTVAERLAVFIADLKLSEEDATLLKMTAQRLVR